MGRVTERIRRPSPRAFLAYSIALLLLVPIAYFILDLESPLGSAGGVQNQRDPTACEAVGINWTNCDSAFTSDDQYAVAGVGSAQGSWGDTTGEGTSFAQSTVRYMGGISPNITGMTVKEVHAYYDGTGTLGLSVYQGGALDDPVGASLVWDAGTVATSGLGWYSIAGGSASLTGDEVTWIGFKSNASFVFSTSWDAGSDFQSVRGRWESTTESNVPTDPWNSTIPTGGSFAGFWYDVYVVYEAVGGGNDTAWRDFGFALNATDTVDRVDVGVEWYRNNTGPILNVTVSWDGGSTWAVNQMATNKSSDDDSVEFLDFTSVTAWTPSKLNDANLRVRVLTNTSGAFLDYLALRVNFIPILPSLTNPALNPSSGDPTTPFNFTIDYSHELGTSAGVVKVNVSDATNNTYNNLTMTPIENPEVDFFVDEYWMLNGTTQAFVNAQSDSDGGASAVLAQEINPSDSWVNQRNPTACEAVENHWSNCQDAFSSNDVYAVAGDGPSYINSVESLGAGLFTSHAVSIPANQENDLILVVLSNTNASTNPSASYTPPGAFTEIYDENIPASSAPRIYLAWALAPAGGMTSPQTFTASNASAFIGIVAVYRGVDTSGPIDASSGTNQATNSAPTSPDITTTVDGALVVRMFWADDNDATDPGSYPSGLNQRNIQEDGSPGNGHAIGLADLVQASAGSTGSAAWSLAGSEENGAATVALAPGPATSPGKNDTAWRDFGYSLNATDTVNMVEVGVEWYRDSVEPILNLTVSWDGGNSWAPVQMATNKSSDDDTVEWLDFTSATAWDDGTLSDANFQVRAYTNESTVYLDYVTARINFATAEEGVLLTQFNTTGRSGGVDTLRIRYNLTSSDDTFNVEVYNFASATWVSRGNLDQTSVSSFNYTLASGEESGGEVRIRFNDTSILGVTDLSIDFQLVNSTLWTTGITYYHNTTLTTGWYDHFFWANDANGNVNRTATFSGPSVVGSCNALTVVTSDPAGQLWFNETVEPDGIPFTSQANVSASFQSGATPALSVTNDGSGSCDITIRLMSNPGTGRSLKFNTTNNAPWPTDTSREVPLTPSFVAVCSSVAPGGTCNIWLWVDYENALGGQASLDVRVVSA